MKSLHKLHALLAERAMVEGDSPLQVRRKTVSVAAVMAVAPPALVMPAICLLAIDLTQLGEVGVMLILFMVCYWICMLFIKKKITDIDVGVILGVSSMGIACIDIAQRLLLMGRSYSAFLAQFACLVMLEAPMWVRYLEGVLVTMYLVLINIDTAVDYGFRAAIEQSDFAGPAIVARKHDICGCDGTCADGLVGPVTEMGNVVITLALCVLFMVEYHKQIYKKSRELEASADITGDVAHELARFDLRTAERQLEIARSTLTPDLYKNLMLILENLQRYRAYLPQSCLPDDSEEDPPPVVVSGPASPQAVATTDAASEITTVGSSAPPRSSRAPLQTPQQDAVSSWTDAQVPNAWRATTDIVSVRSGSTALTRWNSETDSDTDRTDSHSMETTTDVGGITRVRSVLTPRARETIVEVISTPPTSSARPARFGWWDVTLLHVNLHRSFTEPSCSADAQAVYESLLTAAVDACQQRRGVVDVLSADRLHVSFNASHRNAQHCRSATSTALALADVFAPTFAVNSGLATGRAWSGDIGCDAMRRFCIAGSINADVYAVERYGRARGLPIVCNKSCASGVSYIYAARLCALKVAVCRRLPGAEESEEHYVFEVLPQQQQAEAQGGVSPVELSPRDAAGGPEEPDPQEWMYELDSPWEWYSMCVRSFLAGDAIETVLQGLPSGVSAPPPPHVAQLTQELRAAEAAGGKPLVVYA